MPEPLRRAAARGPADDCAAAVLEVVPHVMNTVRSSMRRNVGESLSIPQFRCLGFIDRNPQASVSDVAAFLGVTLATASAMVDRLVRAGYVVAEPSAQDRRRTALSIQDTGRALLGQIRRGAHRDLTAALKGASAADLDVVTTGLQVLKRLMRHG